MKTIDELHKDLDMMYHIYSDSLFYFQDYTYLISPKTSEESEISKIDLFIRRTLFAYSFMSIIEINKLFGGRNDDYSFDKLLNKLLDNYENSEWKDKISKEKIREWQDKLNSEPVNRTVTKVNKWRNKYLAHNDKNPPPMMNLFFSPNELILFYKICYEILNDIRLTLVDNISYGNPMNEERNAYGILKRLVKHHYGVTIEES